MTSKPETVPKRVKELECQDHTRLFLEFYDWLTEDQDSSAVNASQYLKVLRLFSEQYSGKPLELITKEEFVEFLDGRKKSKDADPDGKIRKKLTERKP